MTKDLRGWRIGVDTGGTFTDLQAISPSGEVRLEKVSSTPEEPASATFDALTRVGLDLSSQVESFVLGTTIATNAVLQRQGAQTIYVTTEGFEDALEIQRIDRRGLYDLQWVKPQAYVPRERCIGVRERILSDGSIHVELTDDELGRLTERIRKLVEQMKRPAIAVSLLFSYVNDNHELLIAQRLREAFPDVPLSISSDVAPIWREYERGNTTVMDAYVKPTIGDFEDALDEGLSGRGMSGWKALMKSNGGQVPIGFATARPVEMVLSGVAAGMIAGGYYARAVDSPRAVTLDMGGTSADIGVVVDGDLRFSGIFEVEWGLPVALPIIDVTTIGAGGGSIASIDSGGLLQVGPESAGADPGPACYGQGGASPTITDANVAIGRLNPDYFLGGELQLDAERASEAVESLSGPLGLSVADAANAIVSMAVENMTGQMRLVTVDRGFDYRSFDLVAFGGAGPLHAAEIARRLGMRRVVIPPSPGLVSAFGALIADERIDRRVTLVRRLDKDESSDLRDALLGLAKETADELAEQHSRSGSDVVITTHVACRYVGQNYEQEIGTEIGHVDRSFELALEVVPTEEDFVDKLAEGFHEAHQEAYGYAMRDQPIQSVYLGATALVPSTRVDARPYEGSAEPPSRTRRVLVGAGEWQEARVYNRHDLDVGFGCDGPAIIEEADSTTYVPPGFTATVHHTQCLILTGRMTESGT